jgi:sugar phosphate permease
MKNIIRALLAGWGAKKLGGGKCGCIGVIVVFLILYWLLGYVFN